MAPSTSKLLAPIGKNGPLTLLNSNASNERNWSPIICGMNKKDLLREVLSIFNRTQSLGEIAQVWQERLKASSRES